MPIWLLSGAILQLTFCTGALMSVLAAAAPARAGQPQAHFADRLVDAGMARINRTIRYDPAYVRLSYPGGDVPPDRGVCTDVIIRAYRALGIDLQRLVHEDMSKAFGVYPQRWGLKRADSNIDHRRVPNLRRFLARHGDVLALSLDGADYKPGDLVTWDLLRPAGDTRVGAPLKKRQLAFAGKPHIGIVTARLSADGKRPLIVHNIGAGTRLDDVLFAFQITARYRFQP